MVTRTKTSRNGSAKLAQAEKGFAKDPAQELVANEEPANTTVRKATLASKIQTKSKTQIKTQTQAKTQIKTPDRDTLAQLRAHVDDIEKRLKRANSLTRTSVRALKTSYATLDGNNHTTALTGHIEELSDRLTGMIEKTRTDVFHDLKIVLDDPRIETLSGALTKANQRLTSGEQNQAEAINAINIHIARLATAVDERMQREERQREKGETLLNDRINTIEKDSAVAIISIGNKVVSVSEDLSEKTQTLRSELAEQALTRQQDYEQHKHDMARRIEAIEDERRNQLPAFERGLQTLSTRLEILESNIDMYERPVDPVISAPAHEIAPQIPVKEQEVATVPYENVQQDDAYVALELVSMQKIVPPANLSEVVAEPVTVPVAPEISQAYEPAGYGAVAAAIEGQEPKIFSTRADTPGALVQTEASIQTDLAPPISGVGNEPQAYAPLSAVDIPFVPQVYGEQQAYDPAIYDQAPPPMPNAATIPAMQTLEPTMESVRPGTEPGATSKKGKARKFKKPGVSGGYGIVRKVALFGGVAVVALFAYKIFAPEIFSADDDISRSTQAVSTKSLASIQVSGGSDKLSKAFATTDGQTFETVEPVGDYSETMVTPKLNNKSIKTGRGQRQSLEVAAADGNAIAQFQLGLSYLEARRDAEAVRLIRLAANQGQPMAQYRLAKLYETGIGVKVNGRTAKNLLMRSAKAGNRIAMHDLGHYYAIGADGSAPDVPQAVKWFFMAADRGVLDSQFNLAVLYQNGSGVPLNLEHAYVWYAIAGAQGDKVAMQRSEAIERELSQEQLAKAKTRVRAYAPKPVDNFANGIFTNLPWVAHKEARMTPNKNISVKGAQEMLVSLGYQVGKPDGTLGPNTRNAIISFERANGLPETGRVNLALIERLQLAVGV